MKHLAPEVLEALAEEPARGAASDLQHLEGCVRCQAALRDVVARRALLRGLVPFTLSDIAFRRVEARLMEAVEQGAASSSRVRWWWLLPAAAVLVALLVGLELRRAAPEPVARQSSSSSNRPVLAAARVEPLTVVWAATGAQVSASGAWRPLGAGELVQAGQRVAGRGLGLVAAAPEVQWAFEVTGRLGVGDGASVRLEEGELRARVSGTGADVAVGGLHALALEAVFAVRRTSADVILDVVEGTVELVDATQARREVRAPSRLRLGADALVSTASAEPLPLAASPARAPRSAPRQPWTVLDASGLPTGTRLTLDGALVGDAPFSALVSSGRHRLGLAAPGSAVTESWVELTGSYVARAVPALVEPVPADPDARAVARLQEELRRQRPKLQACHEKWLKANPAAPVELEVVLRLTVSAGGRVSAVDVDGGVVGELRECLVRATRSLTLSPLGGELELELPLRLTTRRE